MFLVQSYFQQFSEKANYPPCAAVVGGEVAGELELLARHPPAQPAPVNHTGALQLLCRYYL